jgi:hypothetical protein
MYRLSPHWSLHPEKNKGLYRDKDGKLRSPWYDNTIKAKKMTPSAVARELDINYELSVEGVIFKQFQEMHIFRGEFEVNPDLAVIRVLDYGGCNAALFAQKTNFGQMIFFKEIVSFESNTNKMGAAVMAYSATLDCLRFNDYDDPAGEHDKWVSGTSSAQIVNQYGIFPTHGASAACKDRRTSRIDHIHFHLSNLTEDGPAVMFHESMKWTIEAFQSGYRYAEGKDGAIDTDVVDEMHPYEDCMDCTGMALMEEMGITRHKDRPKSNKPKPQRRDKYTGQRIR